MTREQLDIAQYDASIADTSSTTLSVDTSRADKLLIFVDDGTTGSAAESYDMEVDVNVGDVSHEYTGVAGSTSLLHELTAYGNSTDVQITNSSGTSGNYRISVVVYRSVD